MNRFKKQFQKGFTLIELLIVIAVLGVLAAVVLVAIDPGEQISRAEDGGRKSTLGQLADAMQAYTVSQNLSAPLALPASGNGTWQGTLRDAGEIKTTFTAPVATVNCAPAISNQGNYCYAPSGSNFLLWVFLESKSEKDKAAGTTATDCTAGNAAAFVYDSSVGNAGNGCVSTTAAPTAGITLYK